MPDNVNGDFFQEVGQIAGAYAQNFDFAHDDGEDFVQGFLVHILQHSHLSTLFELPPKERSAYLRCAALHSAINFTRSLSRHAQNEITLSENESDEERVDFRCNNLARNTLPSGLEPEIRVLQNEARRELQQLLYELPDNSRSLLSMRYFDEMTSVEIAKALGSTSEAVRQSLVKARRKLKTLLASKHWDKEQVNFFMQIFG